MKSAKDWLTEQVAAASEALLNHAGVEGSSLGVLRLVERPREKQHGDFASQAPLQLAKWLKRAPFAIAEELKAMIVVDPFYVDRLEVVKPGFINVVISGTYLGQVVNRIEGEQDQYGWGKALAGRKILVEYVSANPTGHVNVVSGRSAAVGSSLVNLFKAQGAVAESEFYVNDAGRQARLLGLSSEALIKKTFGEPAEFPEDGYQGEEVANFSFNFKKAQEEKWGVSGWDAFKKKMEEENPDTTQFLSRAGIANFVKHQQEDLKQFRVLFDRWFHEQGELHDRGQVKRVLEELRRLGATYESDGAEWLRLTDRGVDKDEVLVRQTGEPTYYSADIAYHLDKYHRKFDEALDLWGPDHHGHIIRLQKALEILGVPSGWLDIRIVQQVNLLQSGEKVKMSKRAGHTVRLKELMEEVGVDAVRYFYLMRSTDSHLDFDVELAKKQTDENPVYYVQYAHARICNILVHAKDQGVAWSPDGILEGLVTPEEREVLVMLDRFPEVVEQAALNRTPNSVPTYLGELAATFHHFYAKCRVVSDDRELSQARLRLVNAVGTVLRNGLTLLGISAPERM